MDDLTFEEQVQVTKVFMSTLDEDGIAKFLVHQERAISGLSANMGEFRKAYSESYSEVLELRKRIQQAIAVLRIYDTGPEKLASDILQGGKNDDATTG